MTNLELHQEIATLFPFAGAISIDESIVSGSHVPDGASGPWQHWSVHVYKFPIGERKGGNPIICMAHLMASREVLLENIKMQFDKMTTPPLPIQF